MAGHIFYPYRTVPDGIDLSLDIPDAEAPRGDDGTLLLYQLDSSNYVIRAAMRASAETFRSVRESDSKPELWLVARSPEGRYRDGWTLGSSNEGEKTFEWNDTEWRGTLELQAFYLAGGAGGLTRGTTLAWSPVRRVHFTEPRTPPGNNLRVSWRDFQHEDPLKQIATHLYTIVQAGPDAEPEILLNQGVDSLYDILMSRGTHGAKARIRDAVYMQLVHQVWTSVLTTVLESVRYGFADEEELEAAEILTEMPAWQAGILRSWAAPLLGKKDRDEALAELLEGLSGGAASRLISELVLVRVPNAIQERFGTRKAYDGLLKDTGMFNV